MKYLLLTILIISSFTCTSQIDTTANLSNTEKLYGLSVFWKEASYNFAYFDRANINWDSAYQAFIPHALYTKSTYEYYRVLQRFCALLKDGHTHVFMPANLSKGDFNIDISLVYLNEKVFNISIPKKDSSLLPLGSELIKVNDLPTKDFLTQNVFPFVSYSAIHQLYNTAVGRIITPPYATNNKAIRLTFKTPEGKVVTYHTKINTGNKEWLRIPNEIKYQDFFTLLPEGIVYLQIPHFGNSGIVEEFKKHLSQMYNAKGVIMDLRNNGGGNSDIGVEILKYFTEQKQIRASAWKTPGHMAAHKAWGKVFSLEDTIAMSEKDKQLIKTSVLVAKRNYWVGDSAQAYENNLTVPRINAPLIVLIGNNTGSAAEDLLISLDDIKGRAITIGERTYGSTGQPLRFNLSGGGSAQICTKRDTYPDGREFVGYGVKPDIEIKRTIANLLAGRDAVLEKAIQILTSKKSTSKN